MLYLSLGTNLGDRQANLDRAIALIQAQGGIAVVRRSSVYETQPRDVLDQPSFLNMVVECRTSILPMLLLKKLLRIEQMMGRNRGPAAIRRGPRLIDIDILLYNDAVIQTASLTVPHPSMCERRFVLEPLLELAPDIKHPRTAQPLSQFLRAVQDQPVGALPGSPSPKYRR
jgi:2-amino-4-hydroxy-6-hydroxymethyldihydropteridine diphosphokinase